MWLQNSTVFPTAVLVPFMLTFKNHSATQIRPVYCRTRHKFFPCLKWLVDCLRHPSHFRLSGLKTAVSNLHWNQHFSVGHLQPLRILGSSASRKKLKKRKEMASKKTKYRDENQRTERKGKRKLSSPSADFICLLDSAVSNFHFVSSS